MKEIMNQRKSRDLAFYLCIYWSPFDIIYHFLTFTNKGHSVIIIWST